MTAESWTNRTRKDTYCQAMASNHAPTSLIPGTLIGNSVLNTSLNNGNIIGSCAFYAVCAEAI
jgi:hypothetical protein